MQSSVYPYRVFISYSHADRALVERLDSILRAADLDPMWDRDLTGGVAFKKEIADFIANAHVFLPLVTTNSVNRPWSNQEIGYACALGKPILPVSTIPGDLQGMIAGLKAVFVTEDLADAAPKLTAEVVERLVQKACGNAATYECTENNTGRAMMLAEYADSVASLRKYGHVRQQASLTTFHLPDQGPGHSLWAHYFPRRTDDRALFRALGNERRAMEQHAAREGCRLIIDDTSLLASVYEEQGPDCVAPRVRGLLDFLVSRRDIPVEIAVSNDTNRQASLTILGDWFSSEAISSAVSVSHRKGLREALFTRHQPTIQEQIRSFDLLFEDLLARLGWTKASSRDSAISYLNRYLSRL